MHNVIMSMISINTNTKFISEKSKYVLFISLVFAYIDTYDHLRYLDGVLYIQCIYNNKD